MQNVVVKFHNVALPSFAEWRTRLAAQVPNDPAIYDVMREAMKDWFRKTAGHPPGTNYYPMMNPPQYVARFTAAVWVHFVRKEKDRGRTLEVVVIGVSVLPPAGGGDFLI